MSDLLVIVPTRQRPQNVVAQCAAFAETGTTADITYGVDYDDEASYDGDDVGMATAPLMASVMMGLSGGMCATLNSVATYYEDSYRYLGFMGDDHRPRTPGWDRSITAALDALGTGLCYGNDLVHGEALPTAVFMTSDIVRALGYMAPPTLQHLFLDNFWKTLGEEVVAITYLPEVIIEHVHPIAQKAEWDEGYERVNAPAMYEHDRAAFEQWQSSQMALDVAKVRALRAVRA